MSRYGTINGGTANAHCFVVQAADADSLLLAAQGAFFAAASLVPPLVDPVVTSITLTGAGDGHMFFFELEMAAGADADGGADVVGVQFVLSATAEDLQEQIGALQSLSPVLDVQIAGAAKGQRVMGVAIFGTLIGGGGGAGAPFTLLKYVDSGTAVPVSQQNGEDETPYSTIQGAINANLGAPLALSLVAVVYPEDVVVPAGTPVFFIVNGIASLNSLTLDPGASAGTFGGQFTPGSMAMGDAAQFDALGAISVTGTTTIGETCALKTYLTAQFVGDITIGTLSTIVLVNQYTVAGIAEAPGATNITLNFTGSNDAYPGTTTNPNLIFGALSLTAGTSQVKLSGADCVGNIQCAGPTALTACSVNADITAGNLYMRGCKTTSPVAAVVTTGVVELIDTRVAAATWNNALGQAFQLDGFSNYWIKVNGTVLTNPGEKVITEDLVP